MDIDPDIARLLPPMEMFGHLEALAGRADEGDVVAAQFIEWFVSTNNELSLVAENDTSAVAQAMDIFQLWLAARDLSYEFDHKQSATHLRLKLTVECLGSDPS